MRKVLGMDGRSMADSAHVVQYDDNGTADHLWRLLREPSPRTTRPSPYERRKGRPTMRPTPAPRRRAWWRRLTATTGLLALVATALVGTGTPDRKSVV